MKKINFSAYCSKKDQSKMAKIIDLINTMATTVLMKKEPKDLQIMCPFQSLKYGLAVTNHCCEEIKIRVMSRSKCRNIP